MGKLGWSLLILCMTAAGGYAAWRSRDLWLGFGVWCLFVPPLMAATFQVIGEWHRNAYWRMINTCLVMNLVGVAALGVVVLGLAWVVIVVTRQWSEQLAVRAVIGAALGATAGGLALLYAKAR